MTPNTSLPSHAQHAGLLLLRAVPSGSDPLGDKELALLYLICFAAVALLGPGKWSLDGALASRSKTP